MTPWRGRLVILVVLLLTACHSYKNEDYAAMNIIPMRSVCVGRMLIALPKGPQNWQQQFDYGEVTKLPSEIDSRGAFWDMVQEGKNDYLSRKHRTDKSMLSGYKELGGNAAMVLHRDSEYDVSGYNLDRYLWLGHWGYWFKSKALLATDERAQFVTFDRFINQLIPINNTNPPDQPGFCIDSALVTGDTGPIIVDTSVHVQGWPGVRVGMGIRADDGTRAPLPWQSTKDTSPPITAFEVLEMKQSAANVRRHADEANQVVSFEVLRKRERTIAGLTGQEAAYRQELANGQQYYDFNWVSSGNQSGTDELNIAIDLRAGRGQFNPRYKAPPPEDDLLALWDAMLESLKPRTGAR